MSICQQSPMRAYQGVAAVLLHQIRQSRVARDVPYRPGPTGWPPISYEQIGGLWPSTQSKHDERGGSGGLLVRLNGALDSCVDFNFYCNAWIVQNILDAQGGDLAEGAFSDAELARTAKVLAESFRTPDDPSSTAMYFWPKRVPVPGGETAMTMFPTNIAAKIKAILDTRAVLRNRLTALGLGNFVQHHMPSLVSKRTARFFRILRIPEDFDDSSLYASIGAHLRGNADAYPMTAGAWPTDTTQYVRNLLRHAYRPFSSDPSAALIDSRTYFWLRPFLRARLESAERTGVGPELMLPTTWVQSAEEGRAALNDETRHAMPDACNSVDVTICANVLHALTKEMLGNPGEWVDAEVDQLYSDAAELVAWVIESETVNTRSDLALTYYPDLETFYWFAARVVGLLRDPANSAELTPLLAGAAARLRRAMRTATLHLVDRGRVDGDGGVWWQGVLGGTTDRIYITAAAANALIESWTFRDEDGARRFHADTPPRVPGLLDAAALFLREHAVSGRYPLKNAFFSSSVKSDETINFRYPVNFIAYADGREIDRVTTPLAQFREDLYTLGIRGFVDEDSYQKMLEHYQDDLPPPIERRPLSKLIYWCSEDVTRSMCVLALSRYAELLAGRRAKVPTVLAD